MASSNVEMLRGAYDHFNRHTDFDWSLIHPDVEWNAFSFAPVSEFRGHDGVREWLAEVADMFDGLRIEADEMIERGDKVVVVSRMRGRGKGSGVETEQLLVSVWTLRDGLVVRHDAFQDREEALTSLDERLT